MVRRVLFTCFVLLCAATGAAPARAQAPAVGIDLFDAAFRDWMKENGVAKGVLAVSHRGRLVFEQGYGGQDPKQRVLLASLSKAITGRCVAGLIVAGKLRLDSKVGEVLAPFFRQHGEPADPRIKGATVEQLLVHRGGFPPAPRDLMTPAALELLQKSKSPATATPAELLAAALTAPLASAPGEAFRYSNIGYLVLGVMIETVTQASYERFCGRMVLETAGVKQPSLDTTWRSFSSFGGWSLAGAEYLAFLARDPLGNLLWHKRPPQGSGGSDDERAEAVRKFLREPGQDHAATGAPAAWQPVRYGLGQYVATVAPAPSQAAWHTGTWGVPPDTIGMLAMQHESGAAWFAWYTPRPAKDATDALLEGLAALPTKIGTWPAHDLFPERGLGPAGGK